MHDRYRLVLYIDGEIYFGFRPFKQKITFKNKTDKNTQLSI